MKTIKLIGKILTGLLAILGLFVLSNWVVPGWFYSLISKPVYHEELVLRTVGPYSVVDVPGKKEFRLRLADKTLYTFSDVRKDSQFQFRNINEDTYLLVIDRLFEKEAESPIAVIFRIKGDRVTVLKEIPIVSVFYNDETSEVVVNLPKEGYYSLVDDYERLGIPYLLEASGDSVHLKRM